VGHAYADTLRDVLASRLRGDTAIASVEMIERLVALARAVLLANKPASELTFWMPVVASGL